MLKFRTGRTAKIEDLWYKILLHGDSGAGKTWMSSSAPNPIVMLTERNGEQSVRMSAADAPYVIVSNMVEVRAFFKMAALESWADAGLTRPDTLVIDGLTEIQRMLKIEIQESREDGEFSIRDWGTLNEKMRGLLGKMRDLPYHVVCTALSETEAAEDVRYIDPQFQGRKTGGEVMQYFNAVGYVFKRVGASGARGRRGQKTDDTADVKGTQHVAMFDGPARIKCKSCYPLGGTRTGPISDWIDELLAGGKVDDEPVKEAPETAEDEPANPPEEKAPEEKPKRRRGRRKPTA